MIPAPTFEYSRVVDLSRPLVPGGQQHPWFRYEPQIESIVTEPDLVPPQGRWYVVTQIGLSGHAGTHVEAPLHAVEGGAGVGDLAVERFFGEAVVLDLCDLPWSEPIGRARLAEAARQVGGVQDGDIAFFHFDWEGRSAAGGHPPYPSPEALTWLVGQGVKLLGIDSPGLEVPGNKALVNHRILFESGIPLIESLANLSQLRSPRVYVFAQPLAGYGRRCYPPPGPGL